MIRVNVLVGKLKKWQQRDRDLSIADTNCIRYTLQQPLFIGLVWCPRKFYITSRSRCSPYKKNLCIIALPYGFGGGTRVASLKRVPLQ